jgi:hypothetical protein
MVLMAFRVCILMNPQFSQSCIAMTTALRHLMPSGSVSISPLGGFRLEDSAALSSQGRTVLVPTKSRIQRIS